MTEKFTADELHAAAARLGENGAVAKTLEHLPQAEYTVESIIKAAGTAGWQNRVTHVLDEARRLREPAVADDDVLIVGELRAWLERKMGTRNEATISLRRESIDKMMADIASHREPEYPEGTVVKDAKDDWWFRTAFGKWEAFGVSGSVAHDVPARPLKVIS